MALIFADSFDHYGTGTTPGQDNMVKGAWSQVNNYSPLTVRARTGTASLQSTSADSEARISLKDSMLVAGIGVGLWMENLPSLIGLGFSFRNASNVDLVSICPGTDGSVIVKKGAFNGTTLGISDSVLTAGTFHHIEAKVTIDSVVGAVEIRVNGVIALSLTNLDLGTVETTQVAFYSKSVAGNNSHAWDDLTLWDDTGTINNDFIGPVRILTKFAISDTAQADFSKIGASNGFDTINNVPPDGDTTYLGSSNVGDKSAFGLPSLPEETVAVLGVFIPAMGRIDEAGIGNIQIGMVSGTSVDVAPEIVLTPGYSYSRNVFEVDPATGVAWTKSGFEAALIQVEKTL